MESEKELPRCFVDGFLSSLEVTAPAWKRSTDRMAFQGFKKNRLIEIK